MVSLTTKVHFALMLANAFFGIGAVVGALGLSTTHPVAFLVIRQFLAGLLLLGISSMFMSSSQPSAAAVGDDDYAAAKTSKPLQHRKINLQSFILQFKRYWKNFALVALTLFSSQFGTSGSCIYTVSQILAENASFCSIVSNCDYIYSTYRFSCWYYTCRAGNSQCLAT